MDKKDILMILFIGIVLIVCYGLFILNNKLFLCGIIVLFIYYLYLNRLFNNMYYKIINFIFWTVIGLIMIVFFPK